MADDQKDDLYIAPLGDISDFVFDDKVARVFPDMINRSVPGYSSIIDFIALLANAYAQPGSTCYDLGCSLGAATMAIKRGTADRDCKIVAIDNSDAMLDRFRQQAGGALGNIELVQDDICNVDYRNASFVTVNFTMQFLPPAKRLDLLKKLFGGMVPGSCLVLSEKIGLDDEDEGAFHEQLHTRFKLANGYSELEVSQKRAALENVLIRDTVNVHKGRLQEAGFDRVYQWFQCFNFVSLVAFRD